MWQSLLYLVVWCNILVCSPVWLVTVCPMLVAKIANSVKLTVINHTCEYNIIQHYIYIYMYIYIYIYIYIYKENVCECVCVCVCVRERERKREREREREREMNDSRSKSSKLQTERKFLAEYIVVAIYYHFL